MRKFGKVFRNPKPIPKSSELSSFFFQKWFIDTDEPTRVFLTLDLENMFNNASRAATEEFIANTPAIQAIQPFYETLYGQNNLCYFLSERLISCLDRTELS